jgi:hypothetical protein
VTTDTTYQKNAETTSPLQGHAVIALILAVAERRPHLQASIQSFQYDQERGIGILVKDAGHREHLANALKFDKKVYLRPQMLGSELLREGEIEGVHVVIWNLEP